jgi:hypothetical protein
MHKTLGCWLVVGLAACGGRVGSTYVQTESVSTSGGLPDAGSAGDDDVTPLGNARTGDFRCTTDGELQARGSDESSWFRIDQCIAAAFCDSAKGLCQPAPCNSGDTRCNDSARERCNADRTAWEVVETCGSAEQCLADQCLPFPDCELGATRCDGAAIKLCTFGGWATLQLCASAALCDVVATPMCVVPECSPGQARCKGAQREQCNADRTGWELVEMCASADRCTPDACL